MQTVMGIHPSFQSATTFPVLMKQWDKMKLIIDNLPFVRLSQHNVSCNKKLSDDVYTSESVDVPNAQVEKYQQNIELLTSTTNNKSSPFTEDNAQQPAINIPSSPSRQHDSQGTVPKSTTPFPIAQAHP